MESKKLYYTMGEVSELFCVAPSLIRYWEKHFSVIKPVRNKKGNRLFTPADVENFKIIYHLVKERGMTLEGAQRTMKQNKRGYSRDAELLERMQHIRAMLLEVREELKEPGRGDENIDVEGEQRENCQQDHNTMDFKDCEDVFRRTIYLEGVSDEVSEDFGVDQGADVQDDGAQSVDDETIEIDTLEIESIGTDVVDIDVDTTSTPNVGDPIDHSTRNTNRTPDAQNKELFAFYEQSLF